jgi:hypothetical protein
MNRFDWGQFYHPRPAQSPGIESHESRSGAHKEGKEIQIDR